MACGTLYTYAANFRAFKALIAAEYSGVQVRIVNGPPEFVFGETNKSEEFRKKFPLGKVPAFETSDNKFIFESNAIAHYIGNEQLRGETALDQAFIIQWINFADHEILPSACTWVFPCLGIMQYNKQAADRAKEDIIKALNVLNSHLLTRTYLVGERITQADITVCCNLLFLYEHVLDPAFRKSFENVNRWFTTLVNQPQFKKVIGDFKLCEKMAQFDAKKFAEFMGKESKGGKKEGKSPKEGKPPKEAKKEKEPKKEEEEELDETEKAIAEESKKKDPFDDFPKGTFVMDSFKRVYSNEDEQKSIAYFWENFDKENYSIWYSEYKYPEELSLIFMSCNLITGMFQRLDKMRKNAFGSVCLFGEDHNNTISGIWIWRGHQLAFELSSDWQVDYESYSWTKLDADAEDTKKLVNEYLAWEGDFGGKKFNQGKIFK
ncbi:elongation factor 1-gamma [Tachypleus tridentatus]|uniref:elongation factor 1-gamma n=1 Tax=Tachypleus tridentatus TaxID=6853 RepID=UPI003FD2029C